MCPCKELYCNHSDETVCAAEALLILAQQPLEEDLDVLEGANSLMVLLKHESSLEIEQEPSLEIKQEPSLEIEQEPSLETEQEPSLETGKIDIISETPKNADFEAYRQKRLEELRQASGGELFKFNPNMRRQYNGVRDNSKQSDENYMKKRSRNNECAKQSRDRQKSREIENRIKLEFYQLDNKKRKIEVNEFKETIKKLKMDIKKVAEHLQRHNALKAN